MLTCGTGPTGVAAMAAVVVVTLGLTRGSAEAQQRPPPLAETPQSTDPAVAPLNQLTDEPQPTFVYEGDSFTADLTISGVDRAVLVWDDGGESDAYFVDNAQDGTFLGVEGNDRVRRGMDDRSRLRRRHHLCPLRRGGSVRCDRLRQQALRVGPLCQHRPGAAGHDRRRLRRHGQRRHRQRESRRVRTCSPTPTSPIGTRIS